ncbi:hypothetical protein GR160_17265 [Flavobacterium sp. Sd200]|uniref:hypothetical protein n=1 Tax=Flavobacterium sp. Sd200 TaxID=2692211 RepID=UPI00136966CD|nr:hypothetical protein [Flavobacterium sp. Sd200]MXN92978.1 hypothetical protein [Flavobacterium sp. Sd200]
MKYFKITVIVSVLLLLAGCWGTDDDFSGSQYRAIVMKREALERSVELQSPQAVGRPGKIYIKDGLLFVTEINKGFHVYNYQNQQSPVPLAFIKVPGATDVAVRGTSLYINQATDLVTLNYSNNAIAVTGRNRNVFPQKMSPDDSYINVNENDIITDWVLK